MRNSQWMVAFILHQNAGDPQPAGPFYTSALSFAARTGSGKPFFLQDVLINTRFRLTHSQVLR